jgi:hypothetical protein
MRTSRGNQIPGFGCDSTPCCRFRENGPVHVHGFVGMGLVGHKISAQGSAFKTFRSARF